MKESYRKGERTILTPNHVRAGREAALEALDRGTCRLGIHEVDEIRNSQNQKRRQYQSNRKALPQRVANRECVAGTAESKTPRMHGNFTHANRKTPLPSAAAPPAPRTSRDV